MHPAKGFESLWEQVISWLWTGYSSFPSC